MHGLAHFKFTPSSFSCTLICSLLFFISTSHINLRVFLVRCNITLIPGRDRKFSLHHYSRKTWCSSVDIVTKLQAEKAKIRSSIRVRAKKFFFSPTHPDRRWCTPASYFSGFYGDFQRVRRRGVKLTCYFLLVVRLRMSAALLRPPHMSSGQIYL
jgi:hypothetical protein